MLLTRNSLIGGAVAATAATAVVTAVAGALGLITASGHDPDPGHTGHGLWNDFYAYWGAGRVLNHGGNPYDQAQLRAAYQEGDAHPVLGSGYSYPLFFAHLMRPLALLPAHASALVFAGLSAIALGIAVALLLGSMPRLSRRRALLWGLGIGLVPPVAGSLYVGQANLLVLLLLAMAYRRLASGPTLALAGAIKLFPASGLVALLVRGRRSWQQLSGGVALLIGLLLLPALLSPQASFTTRLSELIALDPYWTNVSLNGWLSRLLSDAGRGQFLPGRLPLGVVVLTLTIVIVTGILVVLWRHRDRPWGLVLGLAVLLGVVAAPKNSIWNDAPLTLCVIAAWPLLDGRPALRRLALGAVTLITMGSVGVFLTLLPGPPAPLTTGLSGLTIVGALLLGSVLVWLHLAPVGRPWATTRRRGITHWVGWERLMSTRH